MRYITSSPAPAVSVCAPMTPVRERSFTDDVRAAQTPAHPDTLSEATLRAASRLRRDTWLFLGTTFAAHAAVIVNLVAVLS